MSVEVVELVEWYRLFATGAIILKQVEELGVCQRGKPQIRF